MRRQTSRLLSLLVLPLALTAACADAPADPASSSSGGTTSAAPSADLAGVTVTPGAAGATPTLALPATATPFRVSGPQHRMLAEGTGAAIPDAAWLDVHHAIYSGVDGKLIASTFGKAATPLRLGAKATVPAFADAVKGHKIGARVLVALPAKDIFGEGALPAGLTADDTVLYVVDVAGQAPMPTAVVPDDKSKPATLTMPSPTPPKDTVVQRLTVGTGAKVEPGQTVRVRYTGATWRDPGHPFDYSGKSKPDGVEFPVGAGQLIKAWDAGIPGETVGSRLLIVAQPADGYGATGNAQAGIKGDDVLVFVLDILDVVQTQK